VDRNKVTLDNVREGLERFNRKHGHYPSAHEIDDCPYLPSSRQIQRKLGGLKKSREVLNLSDLDYRSGSRRQAMINRFLKLFMSAEKETREFLDKRYGEICVHEEKKYGDGRNRVDFFVYGKENFAVEVFNTYSLRNLIANLNIKLHRFNGFPFKLYFVVTCGEFSQGSIDVLIHKKKNLPTPANMKCLTLEEFKKECLNSLPPLPIKTKYCRMYPYKAALID